MQGVGEQSSTSEQKKSILVIKRDPLYEATDVQRAQVECSLTDGAGGAAPARRTLTFVALTGFRTSPSVGARIGQAGMFRYEETDCSWVLVLSMWSASAPLFSRKTSPMQKCISASDSRSC